MLEEPCQELNYSDVMSWQFNFNAKDRLSELKINASYLRDVLCGEEKGHLIRHDLRLEKPNILRRAIYLLREKPEGGNCSRADLLGFNPSAKSKQFVTFLDELFACAGLPRPISADDVSNAVRHLDRLEQENRRGQPGG